MEGEVYLSIYYLLFIYIYQYKYTPQATSVTQAEGLYSSSFL